MSESRQAGYPDRKMQLLSLTVKNTPRSSVCTVAVVYLFHPSVCSGNYSFEPSFKFR